MFVSTHYIESDTHRNKIINGLERVLMPHPTGVVPETIAR